MFSCSDASYRHILYASLRRTVCFCRGLPGYVVLVSGYVLLVLTGYVVLVLFGYVVLVFGYVVLGYVVLVLSGCLVLVSGYVVLGYVMLVVPVAWFCLIVWCCGGGVVFLHC